VLPAAVAQLRCPVCRHELQVAGAALRCASGHSFDIARQGYVDLTAGRVTHEGDTADMVAARAELLARGYFDAVADALRATVLTRYNVMIEIGAGTGHYLARLLEADAAAVGLAVDVSKAALRRAARAHPRMAAVRADVWRGLPIADGAAGLVLNVFAPRSGAEFARILAPGGAVIVVTPEPGHLRELVSAAGLITVDPAKQERLAATLEPALRRESDRLVEARVQMPRKDVRSLIAMGPSARHVDWTAFARVLAEMPEPITATISVRLSVWRI
jgi:23S rRNA (guanine745-N1)-methyltransferase